MIPRPTPAPWLPWCVTHLPDATGHPLELHLPFGRIAALRFGTPGGIPVLALHGWLDNAASFIPLAAHLDPALDIVAIDLPGHGRSDWLPAGQPYLITHAVPQVLAIADALGWDRFSLLGHSMGGAIGSLVAAAAPKRIRRLVSIDALGPLAAQPDTSVEQLRRYVAANRKTQRPRRVFADRQAMVELRMAHNHLDQANAQRLVERGSCPVEGGWQWSSDPALTQPTALYLAESQVGELLTAIACPVTVIAGQQGMLLPPLRDTRLAWLQVARLVPLPGGHHLHMDHAHSVAAALPIEEFTQASAG